MCLQILPWLVGISRCVSNSQVGYDQSIPADDDDAQISEITQLKIIFNVSQI